MSNFLSIPAWFPTPSDIGLKPKRALHPARVLEQKSTLFQYFDPSAGVFPVEATTAFQI